MFTHLGFNDDDDDSDSEEQMWPKSGVAQLNQSLIPLVENASNRMLRDYEKSFLEKNSKKVL